MAIHPEAPLLEARRKPRAGGLVGHHHAPVRQLALELVGEAHDIGGLERVEIAIEPDEVRVVDARYVGALDQRAVLEALYASGGALKWRGSAGTVTTIAAA